MVAGSYIPSRSGLGGGLTGQVTYINVVLDKPVSSEKAARAVSNILALDAKLHGGNCVSDRLAGSVHSSVARLTNAS